MSIATVTEMYREVDSWYSRSIYWTPLIVSPVDFAAAFWIGTHDDKDSIGDTSLFAWAKRAEEYFVGRSLQSNENVLDGLNKLQFDYGRLMDIYAR